MIQLLLHDVRVFTRNELTDMAIQGPHEVLPSWTVILKSITDERALAVWIGPSEGEALARYIAADEPMRPMTYTFISRLIEGLGATVQRAEFVGLENDIFFATLTLVNREEEVVVDARPSDAINVALRAGAPIFVDETILEHAGFTVSPDVVDSLRALSRALGREEPEGAEWKAGVDVIKEFDKARQELIERRRAARERGQTGR